MKKEDKGQLIDSITEVLNEYNAFYITDISDFNSERTTELRSTCFKKDIRLMVVKNTLLRKAMEKSDKNLDELYDVLKGSSSLMLTPVGNAPAKLIQEFRKKYKLDKPIVKGAYVEEAVFTGDSSLETLANIKSKEELIGDIIGLLQSPAKNVVSALKSGGQTIAGLVKTLQEREN